MDKAPHGSPCNNCGGCCIEIRCPLGEAVYGPGRQCPALEPLFIGLSYGCGMISDPGKHAPAAVARHGREAVSKAAALLIGAGKGCDSLVPGERPNEIWRAWARKEWNQEREDGRAAAAWAIWRNPRG